jgi:hypothetical protein
MKFGSHVVKGSVYLPTFFILITYKHVFNIDLKDFLNTHLEKIVNVCLHVND